MRARAIGLASSRLTTELVSDERLVARLREGDRRAFEAIYDRYERPIRSFCRHMVGQPEDADDAAQHVFLSAYRSIVHTTKPIDLRPWLFTIARNRCRSLLRARYRAMAFSEGTEYEPSVEGLGVQVERREQLTELLRDIARLPEDQRAALLLAQLGTLRHSEVALVLEVPSDKVKALIFQARSSLLASQMARETPCCDIREQLTTQSGAALRRSNLRRHLRDCAGCRDFEARLKHQRTAMRVLLPVAGAPAIRSAVISHAASGGAGAAGAGSALGGIALKMVAMQAATAVGVAAAGAGAVVVASRIDHASSARAGTPEAKVARLGHVTTSGRSTASPRSSGALVGHYSSGLIATTNPPRGHHHAAAGGTSPVVGSGPVSPAPTGTTPDKIDTVSAPVTSAPQDAPPTDNGGGDKPKDETVANGQDEGNGTQNEQDAGGNGNGQGNGNGNGQANGNGPNGYGPPGQLKKEQPPTGTEDPPPDPTPAPGNGNGNGKGNGNRNGKGNGNGGGHGNQV